MKTFNLALMLLFLAGCGAKAPEEEGLDMLRVNQNTRLDIYVNTLKLDAKTPDGLGTVLSLWEGDHESIGFCTWFLVDEQLALTNSHCIPDLVKIDGRNCKRLMQGVFKTSSGTEVRSCKRLIKASSLGSSVLTTNDYALIELDKKVEANNFNLTRTGMHEGEKVKILTMNQKGQDPIDSKFVTHECVIRSSDIFGRWVSEGTSPLTAFKEELSDNYCKTVQSNSGAPVINEKGDVVGILHGGVDETAKLTVKGPYGNKTTNNVAVFTNFRCLTFDLDKFDHDLPDNCDEAMRDPDETTKRMSKALEDKFSAILRNLVSSFPNFVEYKIDSQNFGNKTYVYFSPKCVHPLERWSEADKKAIQKTGLIFKTQEIDLRLGQYEFNNTITSDYYGNFVFEVESRLRFTDWFQLKQLEKLGKEMIPVIIQPGNGVLERVEMKIGLCQTK